MKNVKRAEIKLYILVLLFIGIFAVIASIIYILNMPTVSLDELQMPYHIHAPIQTETTGKVNKDIQGYNAEINFIAEYKISGRVVDVHKYTTYTVDDLLSPIDVGMAWGFLAEPENYGKIKWSSKGNRILNTKLLDAQWFKAVGKKNVGMFFSNNHLIPSNDDILKDIKNIIEGSFITIEGYLVNVHVTHPNGGYTFDLESSTTRKDNGNGACEIIYVTKVEDYYKE